MWILFHKPGGLYHKLLNHAQDGLRADRPGEAVRIGEAALNQTLPQVGSFNLRKIAICLILGCTHLLSLVLRRPRANSGEIKTVQTGVVRWGCMCYHDLSRRCTLVIRCFNLSNLIEG